MDTSLLDSSPLTLPRSLTGTMTTASLTPRRCKALLKAAICDPECHADALLKFYYNVNAEVCFSLTRLFGNLAPFDEESSFSLNGASV